MENRSRINSRGMEVNTMAILDASGFNKGIAQDQSDDRITFLEAVRSASLVPDNGIAPTKKMFEAIFQILKDENSLELIMTSYRLLSELDKHFPQVHKSKVERSKLPSPSSTLELVVVDEAWSPFIFGSDGDRRDANRNFGKYLDSSGFHLLIQDLVKVAVETKFEELETKSLRNMLLLQYLINVLEGDFLPRNSVYKENMNWNLLRESLLNMLLGSRRINYKGLIKDFLLVICELSHAHTEVSLDKKLAENSAVGLSKSCDTAIAISFPEAKKSTCIALQKFLLMAMELDTSKKKADMQGLTTRTDGLRTPVAEIIQDELTYNRAAIPLFFQVFSEPKWKLEIIVQYFQKYISKRNLSSAFMQPFAEGFPASPLLQKKKPSVRTRRSSDPIDDATFDGILKCFLNSNSVRSIIKKISTEVAQLLLAHAFQAYLSLSSPHLAEGIYHIKEDVKDGSLVEICKNLLSAFTNLRRLDEHVEILPLGKAAVFTAATILSTKS